MALYRAFEKIARWSPFSVLAALGIATSLILVILTPPYMVPDETTHFKRAYSVSLGTVWPDFENGKPGFRGPASVQVSINNSFGPGAYPATVKFLADQLNVPFEREKTQFFEFRPETIYPPLGYLPQAAGIAIGRIFDAPVLIQLYLARLLNLTFAAVVMVWAMKVAPFGREPMLLVALLPMTLHLVASASPDAMTISGGLLLTALIVDSFARDEWGVRRILQMMFAGALLCSTRSVNAPLAAAACSVVLLGPKDGWRWGVASIMAFYSIGLMFLNSFWLWSVGALSASSREGADPQAHAALLRTEPFESALFLISSFIHDAPMLIAGMLGILFWNNGYLFVWHYSVLVVLVPLSVLACRCPAGQKNSLPGRLRGWPSLYIAVLMIGIVTLIEIGLFIVWTRTDAEYVEGVQGRYFQPLIAMSLILMALALKLDRRPFFGANGAYAVLVLGLTLSCLATVMRVVHFFRMI